MIKEFILSNIYSCFYNDISNNVEDIFNVSDKANVCFKSIEQIGKDVIGMKSVDEFKSSIENRTIHSVYLLWISNLEFKYEHDIVITFNENEYILFWKSYLNESMFFEQTFKMEEIISDKHKKGNLKILYKK